jgi:co-chaperonin GroES (HSP10)
MAMLEKEEITPENFYVLAEVTELEKVKNGIYSGSQQLATKTNIEYYYGKALSLGPKAKDPEQCVEVEVNKNIVFSQFAGFATETKDGYCKVIRSSDIVAIVNSNFEDMTEKTIEPTGERILVKIIGEGLVQDGIYDDTSDDPREAITQKGIVIKCAKNAQKYKPGTIVAFEPYCGNLIVNEHDLKLKTVNSFDILYSVKK